MRLTIVGSGDAFGSGGRFNTCFLLETAKGKLLVDCGASSLVALKAQGLDPNEVDGIVLSHLHGDHFGALPFLLLDAQFLTRRERPLLIAGPPGTRAQSLEVFFPRSSANKWRFSWNVMEVEVARPTEVLGHCVTTHRGGALLRRALDCDRALRRRQTLRLFRRHRVGGRARLRRRRRRSLCDRMLRLFRRIARPYHLGRAQAAVA